MLNPDKNRKFCGILTIPSLTPLHSSILVLKTSSLTTSCENKRLNTFWRGQISLEPCPHKASYPEIYHDFTYLAPVWKPHLQNLSLFNLTKTLLSGKFLSPECLLKIINGDCLASWPLQAAILGGIFQREKSKEWEISRGLWKAPTYDWGSRRPHTCACPGNGRL